MTKKVHEDLKWSYPHIEWKEMAGMRDRLIHDYFGIDYDVVYNTITTRGHSDLHQEIQRILKIEGGK